MGKECRLRFSLLKEPPLDTQDWASSGSVEVFFFIPLSLLVHKFLFYYMYIEKTKGDVSMVDKGKIKILIDPEELNRLNAEGYSGCGHRFNLGDEVVLSRGNSISWQMAGFQIDS
jgi:hypothetical protein